MLCVPTICKLSVIFEVSITHPEAGSYAPCTLYMYREISSLDIKDKGSRDISETYLYIRHPPSYILRQH